MEDPDGEYCHRLPSLALLHAHLQGQAQVQGLQTLSVLALGTHLTPRITGLFRVSPELGSSYNGFIPPSVHKSTGKLSIMAYAQYHTVAFTWLRQEGCPVLEVSLAYTVITRLGSAVLKNAKTNKWIKI